MYDGGLEQVLARPTNHRDGSVDVRMRIRINGFGPDGRVKSWWTWVAGCCSVLTLSFPHPGGAAPSSAETGKLLPLALLRLEPSRTGELFVRIDGKEPVAWSDLRARNTPTPLGAATLAASSQDSFLEVRSEQDAVRLVVEGFEGWAANLAKGQRFSLRLFSETKVIEILTKAENSDAVQLEFADGGRADVGPESSLHFDLFNDQSYLISGHGAVSAVNADGQKFVLSRETPPMTGGPLISVPDSSGGKHLERVTPRTEVIIQGEMDSRLSLVAGRELIEVPDSESGEVVIENGSVIQFQRNAITRTLELKIPKGNVRLSVEGIPGWKAVSSSGQSVLLVWDQSRKAVDLVNRSPDSTVLVNLPHATQARVGPGSTFQYTQVSPLLFSTSGSGSRVTLYNPMLGRETDLTENNHLFLSGAAIPSGARTMPNNAVRVSWRADSSIEVQSSSGNVRVLKNEEKTLPGTGGGQLQVEHDADGKVRIKALVGHYMVYPGVVRDVGLDLGEGNGVMFGYDRGSGIFTGRALADNLSGIKLEVASGYTPIIQPDQRITFFSPVLSDFAAKGPTAVFQPNRGSVVRPASRPDSIFEQYNNQLVADRIAQSAISVVR